MSHFAVEVLTPVSMVDGANALAAVCGITELEELTTFSSANVESGEAKYIWRAPQVVQEWWDGIVELAANPSSLERPLWDTGEVLDLVAGAEVLATVQVVHNLDELETELPTGMVVLLGQGLLAHYNLTPVEAE